MKHEPTSGKAPRSPSRARQRALGLAASLLLLLASLACTETDAVAPTTPGPERLEWSVWETVGDVDGAGDAADDAIAESVEADEVGEVEPPVELAETGSDDVAEAEPLPELAELNEVASDGDLAELSDADELPPEAVEVADAPEADEGVEEAAEADSAECATAGDCAGMEAGDCAGWWSCEAGSCLWSCPPPYDLWSRQDLFDDQQLLAETVSLGELVHEDRLYQVTDLRLRSFEWADGAKTSISMRGILAVPLSGSGVKPAIIRLHGLTSLAAPEEAMELAGSLDAAVLSLNGPGQGGSLGTGPATEIDVIFRSEPDPRASWTYAYALGATRAVTWLQGLDHVQSQHIGMMGRGLGGAVAMMVNGLDERLAAILLVETAGDIITGAKQGSWYNTILSGGGFEPYDAALEAWAAYGDALPYAPRQHGPVLLAVGAQDEYHPLTTVASTYEAIAGTEKRLALIANWDAAWYHGSTGFFNTFNNAALATRTILDATRVWFRRHLHEDAAYPALTGTPDVLRSDDGLETSFTASVPGVPGGDEDDWPEVRVQYSGDGAYTFASIALQPVPEAPQSPVLVYAVTTNIPPSVWGDHNLIYFVEARYPTGPEGEEELLLCSSPHRYPSFSPQIRPQSP